MSGSHFHVSRGAFQYLVCVVLLTICGASCGATIGSDDLSVEYTQGSGLSIGFRGVPVVRSTSLQLYAPGWSRGYYTSTYATPAVKSDDKQIVIAHHAGKGVDFDATETIRLTNSHRIEITLEGKLASNVPAKMEWAIGMINAFTLYGGGYAAGDDEKMTAIAPMAPKDTHDCTVIRGAHKIRFTSPIGTITYSSPDIPMSLLDGRLELGRHWSQEIPSFWLGALSEDVAAGKPFKYVVTIEYQPSEPTNIAPAISQAPPTRELADAFVPEESAIQIIPKPKQLKWNDGKFRLDDSKINPRFHAEDFSDPERYTIHCDANGIDVYAATDQARFYATKTLEQMIQSDAEGAFIPACDIDDWPTLKFRGVHLFPGKGAMNFHRKLIERIFAGFKINHVVLECEFAQWETNPKLWTDISISKDDLREYANVARKNFVEPIPLVQSLGHAEWMFKNGQNRDIAEDPRAGWAYDATNPKSYEFIQKVYDEAIDLFHPKFFHVGHDEVTMRGEYPFREESKKHGVAELFAMDVKKLDEYFRPKGIRMMLWGDMMLAKEESSDSAANATNVADAKLMRAAIPKDAIVCDWHYQPAEPSAYKSLQVFRDEGVQTIASTWYNPANISSFAAAAQKFDSLGVLQTTWAGFNIDERAMQKSMNQFSAYVLAAEYAWSGQEIPADQLPYRADEVFARAMNPSRQARTKSAGATVDLSEASNLALDEPPLYLASLPIDQRFAGVRFDMHNRAAIALRGELIRRALPKSVSIDIESKANAVALLHVASFRASANEEIGRYEIAYDDGTSEHMPLRYGTNIRAIDDLAISSDSMLGWSGKASHGGAVGVRVFNWVNAHPEKAIQRITFLTDHPHASPVLIGMTLLRNAEGK